MHNNVMKGAFRQQVSLVLPYWCMQADKKSLVCTGSINKQVTHSFLFLLHPPTTWSTLYLVLCSYRQLASQHTTYRSSTTVLQWNEFWLATTRSLNCQAGVRFKFYRTYPIFTVYIPVLPYIFQFYRTFVYLYKIYHTVQNI